ncbi:unnamed protein product [Heligmosomoides polygyrus]|uniref:Uncharacterized protein n=1 Tax=Heligmosomoides polygyrus TaxID=6339 RepID=A0A183GPZ7_HELPZ|nr:unnamed protein product [Heligmosomoides polygyrus]
MAWREFISVFSKRPSRASFLPIGIKLMAFQIASSSAATMYKDGSEPRRESHEQSESSLVEDDEDDLEILLRCLRPRRFPEPFPRLRFLGVASSSLP